MRPFLLAIAFAGILSWIPAGAGSLLILSITGDSTETDSLKTVNSLYRDAIQAQYPGRILFAADSILCEDRVCALKALSDAGTDQVIHSQLRRLGTKWIFSSTLLSANGDEPFHQSLTALSIEDMDAVTRRMAGALLGRKNTEQVASLDNITQKENTQDPERRRSYFSSGGSLGYLWPVGKSFGYRVPSDTVGIYRLKTNSPLVHFTWLNTWELKKELLLVGELAVEPVEEMPVIGGDLTLDYLLDRGDFSPFFGGGIGLHYVTPDADHSPHKRNSGPTLNLDAGLMLFRTYDVRVLVRTRYRLILNTDIDNGFLADVAVTYKMKAVKEQADEDVNQELKIAGYSALGLLALVLLVALAN